MARMLFLRDIEVDVQLRCCACGHGGVLPRGMLERRFGPNYPVLSIAPHYRCSRCDSRDTESRPARGETLPDDGVAEVPADLSFDAPLAALQGLLASVRGPEKAERHELPSWGGGDDDDGDDGDDGGDDTLPAFPSFAALEPDLAETDEDEADFRWPEPQPEPVRPSISKATSAKKAARPLEDLVADGPADEDAAPLWEPVSLADMAARLGAARPGDGGPSPFDEDTEAAEPAAETQDEPFDETLAAMRRFFADAELTEEEAEESGEEEAEPPVFSHKALVRDDFDDDFSDFDEEAADELADGPEPADEPDDDEPTDEEILAFAIRDPEKVAPPPPKPRVERLERATKPPPADEDEGFDKTLAALRSMIEDAATEPKVVPVQRKTRPVEEPAPEPVSEPMDEVEEPVVKPAGKAAGKPSAKAAGKAPTGKRSAQEREIEEAMKALRDMVEDDDAPAARGGKPKLGLVRDEGEDDRPLDPPPMEEAVEESPPPAKKRGEAASDASPLSKTIAALRGMLELDGRRKR